MYAHTTGAMRTAFMRGWDAGIVGEPLTANPYHREDSKRWWLQGRRRCLAGCGLPTWYNEWRRGRAGRRYSNQD